MDFKAQIKAIKVYQILCHLLLMLEKLIELLFGHIPYAHEYRQHDARDYMLSPTMKWTGRWYINSS